MLKTVKTCQNMGTYGVFQHQMWRKFFGTLSKHILAFFRSSREGGFDCTVFHLGLGGRGVDCKDFDGKSSRASMLSIPIEFAIPSK